MIHRYKDYGSILLGMVHLISIKTLNFGHKELKCDLPDFIIDVPKFEPCCLLLRMSTFEQFHRVNNSKPYFPTIPAVKKRSFISLNVVITC